MSGGDWMAGGVVDNDREEAYAAARYGDDYYDDGPTRAEAEADAAADRAWEAENPRCQQKRTWTDEDGMKWEQGCTLRLPHGRPHPGDHSPGVARRLVCPSCGVGTDVVNDACGEGWAHPPF